MNERELRDTRYVWHCQNRYSKFCQKDYCKGTTCRGYRPTVSSYHYFKQNDPIKGEK